MKPSTITSKLFGGVIAIAVLALAMSAQAMQQGSARVIKLVGAARYSTGNNVWLPISTGTALRPGSVIQTASESVVDVLLSGEEGPANVPVSMHVETYTPRSGSLGEALQNVVRLRENTLMAIDRLTWEQTGADTVTDTQLDLRAGSILGSVKKASAASRYEVKVPNGVAGIRGTIYSFSTSGILTVYAGSIVITYLNPSDTTQTITQVVSAGQQYDMTTGQFTQVPVPIVDDNIRAARELALSPALPAGTQIIYTPTEPQPILSPVQGDDGFHAPPPETD